VTVWRHAEAAAAGHDASRPITVGGRKALQSSVEVFIRWLESAGVVPVTSLFYSPYLRTRETAELLCSWCLPAHAEADDRLVPGARVEDVAALVDPEREHVLLVSHQPLVSALISLWCDDATLAPLAPGGSTTMNLLCAARGGAPALSRARADWLVMGGLCGVACGE